MTQTSPQSVRVDLSDRSYDIHIGRGLLSRAPDFVPFDLSGRSLFILYDHAVEAHALRLQESLPSMAVMMGVQGGEKTKSYDSLQTVLDWLLSNKVDRQSVLFVVGGGVLGDLGGFAASIVMRGIAFVQVPTTLLSQVDSSVGGKTGINTAQGKNLVGTFYQPVAVLCDLDTLDTLPMRERKAGYAEIVKYGLLGDAIFFEWLEKNGKDVLSLSDSHVTTAIEKSCMMKSEIVGQDEREQKGGRRAMLNFGHTFGHALEAAAGYDGRLLHGEAVAIGMVLAMQYSYALGLCSAADVQRVQSHFQTHGIMTRILDISPPLMTEAGELIRLMQSDKKSQGGKIAFILSRGIGQAFQTRGDDPHACLEILCASLAKVG